MSITRTYSVFCDVRTPKRCHVWIAETTESAAAARREARAAGWRTSGADVCPACQKVG